MCRPSQQTTQGHRRSTLSRVPLCSAPLSCRAPFRSWMMAGEGQSCSPLWEVRCLVATPFLLQEHRSQGSPPHNGRSVTDKYLYADFQQKWFLYTFKTDILVSKDAFCVKHTVLKCFVDIKDKVLNLHYFFLCFALGILNQVIIPEYAWTTVQQSFKETSKTFRVLPELFHSSPCQVACRDHWHPMLAMESWCGSITWSDFPLCIAQALLSTE